MNDAEFLDYCYWHSRTERHLFSWEHVRRLLHLSAEYSQQAIGPLWFDLVYAPANSFIGMDFEFVEKRVERARDWLAWAEKNPRVREAVDVCPRWHGAVRR